MSTKPRLVMSGEKPTGLNLETMVIHASPFHKSSSAFFLFCYFIIIMKLFRLSEVVLGDSNTLAMDEERKKGREGGSECQ